MDTSPQLLLLTADYILPELVGIITFVSIRLDLLLRVARFIPLTLRLPVFQYRAPFRCAKRKQIRHL